MTNQKPTGVFVRLPLSVRDAAYMLMITGTAEVQPSLLAIGTPVTGGGLDYCAQIVWHEDAVEPEVAAWRRHDIKKGDNIKVVSQTDALAKLAEKDAEIARLWSALEDIEMGIDALPDDNEDYSKMSAREMRRQALEVVKAEVKALKGPEA